METIIKFVSASPANALESAVIGLLVGATVVAFDILVHPDRKNRLTRPEEAKEWSDTVSEETHLDAVKSANAYLKMVEIQNSTPQNNRPVQF